MEYLASHLLSALVGAAIIMITIGAKALRYKHLALVEVPRRARVEAQRLMYVERIAAKALRDIIVLTKDQNARLIAQTATQQAWGAGRGK